MAAQIGGAVVAIDLAAAADKASRAVANERVVGIAAGAAVEAGRARAIIQVLLAVGAAEAVDAVAVVAVDAVRAVAVVATRARHALVDVHLAVVALETWISRTE